MLLAEDEDEDGLYVHADEFVFRMEPESVAETTFHATRFGAPAAGVTVYLRHDSSIMQVPAGDPAVGVPVKALSFPDSITTDADSTAVLTLNAGKPGNPRVYFDGQLYGVVYGVGGPPRVGATGNSSYMPSVLEFDEYPVVDDPTWVGHIQPILERTPTFPRHAPQGRPRELRQRHELAAGAQDRVLQQNRKPELRDLHARYNVYAAATIRSVAIEEILQMALMSNLLLSIGFVPKIGSPGLILAYPGPLPGGVGTGLIARLRKCSIDQIRDVFVASETPRNSCDFGEQRSGPRRSDGEDPRILLDASTSKSAPR